MDLPLCKICGERHRLGFCPEYAEFAPPQRSRGGVESGHAATASHASPLAAAPGTQAHVDGDRPHPLAASEPDAGVAPGLREAPSPSTVPRSAGGRGTDGAAPSGPPRRPSGRPLKENSASSLAATQPWKGQFSRATWFRRQHEAQ